MRILGIDPGIGRMGWGIVVKEKGKVAAVAFDCLETPATLDLPKRLQLVHAEVTRLIQLYNPDVMSIEDLFFSKNAKTAFAVGQARGVTLLAASEHNIPVIVYTPPAIKSAITGYGKADKKQIGEMVKMTLHLSKVPTPDDTADALAIALTHAFTTRFS